MQNNNEHQIVLMLIGEPSVGKTWLADKLVKEFGFNRKISIDRVLKQLASDQTVFNIPLQSFESDKIDVPFQAPLQIKEMHIRRLLGRVGLLLPITLGFNPNRVAISNFICPRIVSPKGVLDYIEFDILNKINPEYLPMLAYQDFIGLPGIFIVDDLKTQAHLNYARSTFQLVYTALVDCKKKKKKDDSVIVRSEIDWDSIQPDYTLMNEHDSKKMENLLLDFVSKFNSDISNRIKSGYIAPLPKTKVQQIQDWTQASGPLGQKAQGQKEFTTGKANFIKGNLEAMLTPNERIRDYHVRGQS